MHNSAKQNLWSEFFVSGVLLLLACNFALVFARDGQYFLPINNYIDLEVRLPYQYRILMVPVFRSLLHFFEIVDLQRLFTHVPPYLATSEALAYCTVNSVSFFVAAQIFRRIAFSVFQSKRLTAFAVSLFVVIIYMAFVINPNLNYILPYDLPSLAFMQAGTLLIIRKRWKTAIGLFAIATINRETTFLLIAFLVFSWWFDSRKERSGAFATAAVLSVIWVAVKIVLSLTITGNGSDAPLGGVAAMKIGYNLAEFLKPWQWPSLLPNFLPLGILAMLLTGKLKSHREWHMTSVTGYVALFVVAQVTEFRAFGDLIGFFAISLTVILCEYDRDADNMSRTV
jgi:hypothetical protein